MSEPAEDKRDQNARDDSAVDGEPALPDREDLCGMREIVLRLKEHKVQSGAQNRQGNHPDHHVINIVGADPEFRRPSGTVENPQNKAQGDDHAVKIDLPAEYGKGRGGIERQIAEKGETNDGFTLNGLEQKHRSFLLCGENAERETLRLQVLPQKRFTLALCDGSHHRRIVQVAESVKLVQCQ